MGGDEPAATAHPAHQGLFLLRAEGPLVGGREDDPVAAEVGQSGGVGDDVDLKPAGAVEHPQQRLSALREEAGTTVLFTTHVMEEAERYCERLVIMDEGRLVEQGEPAEVCRRHGTESLEEVFTEVTGRRIDEHRQGRLRDVRARRRIARRLG